MPTVTSPAWSPTSTSCRSTRGRRRPPPHLFGVELPSAPDAAAVGAAHLAVEGQPDRHLPGLEPGRAPLPGGVPIFGVDLPCHEAPAPRSVSVDDHARPARRCRSATRRRPKAPSRGAGGQSSHNSEPTLRCDDGRCPGTVMAVDRSWPAVRTARAGVRRRDTGGVVLTGPAGVGKTRTRRGAAARRHHAGRRHAPSGHPATE